MDQFGLPDVFVTISPFEWSFPFPKWLQDVRIKTGKGPTELAGFETAHIVHTLAQLVRGYLCGSNSNKWSSHVFSYNASKNYSNVKTFFYRFEFQKRGTAHLHLLIWLKDITKIQHKLIRADLPDDNPDLSFLASNYQQSDKPSSSLRLQETESHFTKVGDKSTLHLKHPAEAFACNLQAYISTVLPALECSMDFQTTDNRAMLLRYVTSYVTKWQDGISSDSLYSYNISGGQAAVRYVMEMKPAEPEMWLSLSSTKISWSSSRTKRYVVPSSDTAVNDKTAEKYRNRPSHLTLMPFLTWLRNFDYSKPNPKEYSNGNTLVGLKMLSYFNSQYFFQYIFLHKPHRNISDLQHPNHDNLPANLQWYAAAVLYFGEFWKNDQCVIDFLHNQGNRDMYITTFLAYLHTLADTYYLVQLQILLPTSIEYTPNNAADSFTLDTQQLTIQNHILSSLQKRNDYYSTFNDSRVTDTDSESDNEDEMDIEDNAIPYSTTTHQSIDVDWKKPVVVTGEAGCGKSYTIRSIVTYLVQNDANVLVAAPTGFLASVFKATLPEEAKCETVHASFHYPVNSDIPPSINWQLSNFDVLIIDEISMIPDVIFQHILKTLNVLLFRPVVLFSGDAGQQQPFSRQSGKIFQLESPFDNNLFLNSSYNYRLLTQHRVGDIEYFSFLKTIRNWVPTQQLLDEIQQGRVITEDQCITDDTILKAFSIHANNTILTFTKEAANRANQVIINSIFRNENPLASLKLDCDLHATNIYYGMRVMITQNRDKVNGVVNGQLAYVHTVHNHSVYLKLPNDKVVAIYQVTMKINETLLTFFPFCPAYATTICKAQGQTLDKALVWFDIDMIPPGTAYVALSRVRSRDDIYFMRKLQPIFFTPVTRLTQLQ